MPSTSSSTSSPNSPKSLSNPNSDTSTTPTHPSIGFGIDSDDDALGESDDDISPPPSIWVMFPLGRKPAFLDLNPDPDLNRDFNRPARTNLNPNPELKKDIELILGLSKNGTDITSTTKSSTSTSTRTSSSRNSSSSISKSTNPPIIPPSHRYQTVTGNVQLFLQTIHRCTQIPRRAKVWLDGPPPPPPVDREAMYVTVRVLGWPGVNPELEMEEVLRRAYLEVVRLAMLIEKGELGFGDVVDGGVFWKGQW